MHSNLSPLRRFKDKLWSSGRKTWFFVQSTQFGQPRCRFTNSNLSNSSFKSIKNKWLSSPISRIFISKTLWFSLMAKTVPLLTIFIKTLRITYWTLYVTGPNFIKTLFFLCCIEEIWITNPWWICNLILNRSILMLSTLTCFLANFN